MSYPFSSLMFMQNDEWTYYLNVENFLNGHFALDKYTGATFYIQGFLAYLFSLVFGIQNLPYLTIIISVLCVYVFYSILRESIKLNKTNSSLLTLIFAINPLFIYSSIGFMNENYLLLFVLLSVKYFLNFSIDHKKRSLYLSLFFTVLSFGVKQTGIFLPIAYFIYFTLKKEYKNAGISFSTILVILGFYEFLFPKTPIMINKGSALVDLPSISSLLNNTLLVAIYVCTMIAPIILAIFIDRIIKSRPKLNVVFFTKIIAALAFVVLYKLIKPSVVGFLFFGNTFTYKGFFPGEIFGDKYYFRAFDNIFMLWEWMGIIAVILLILNISVEKVSISSIRSKVDPILIAIVIYTGLIVTADNFFDRYILTLIPLAIIYISKYAKNNSILLSKLILSIGVISIGFISYNFTLDFVLANYYIWHKSTDLVQSGNISPNQIQGNRAWNIYFEGPLEEKDNKQYIFIYDSEIENYTKVEEKNIKFIGNFFINPKIYLHKANTVTD